MKLIPALLLLTLGALAQAPPPPRMAPPPGEGKKMHAPPKNLKLLQPSDLMPAMRAYRIALGVQCTFCHVEGNFASDEKPTKEMARKMIVMTREVNAKFPDAKEHVTCYTCHSGATEPLTAPKEGEPTGH